MMGERKTRTRMTAYMMGWEMARLGMPDDGSSQGYKSRQAISDYQRGRRDGEPKAAPNPPEGTPHE